MQLQAPAKLAFLFLLTHPHMTALGAMRATIEGLNSELSAEGEDLREDLRKVFRKGLAVYDEKAHLVWLPNFLKYNGPESPNVVKAWSSCIDLLPECETKALVIQRVIELSKDLPKAFQEVFDKTFPKPSERLSKGLPYPEQEQEQEQEPEQEVEREGEKKPMALAAVAAPPSSATQEFTLAWNAVGAPFKPLAQWTASRQKWLGARMKDSWWKEHWREGLERMRKSAFCRGETDRGTWIANIEFFLKPNSVAKLLEGTYDDRNGTGKGGKRSAASAGYSQEFIDAQGDKFHGR